MAQTFPNSSNEPFSTLLRFILFIYLFIYLKLKSRYSRVCYKQKPCWKNIQVSLTA